MAALGYLITDPEVMTVWEQSLEREVRLRDPLLDPEEGLTGDSDGALVKIKEQLKEKGGSTLRLTQKYQLESPGRAGDAQLKGHEDSFKTATFDMKVHVLRQATGVSSPIVQQWVAPDVMQESLDSLADWFAQRLPFALHLHAAGIGIVTQDEYNVNNTINAINSSYIFRPNAKAAGALTSSDTFDQNLVDLAAMKLKLLRPKIKPAMTKYGPKYCCFLAPEQVRDLRDSSSQWYGEMIAAVKGGRIEDNGIFTRALGEHNGVIYYESDFVPPGLNSGETAFKDKTRRAWIGGAGALALAFGRGWAAPGFDLNRFQWDHESDDYGHKKYVAATTIVGIARPRFTKPTESSAREQGVVVLETYADYGAGQTSTEVYKDYITATGGAAVEA